MDGAAVVQNEARAAQIWKHDKCGKAGNVPFRERARNGISRGVEPKTSRGAENKPCAAGKRGYVSNVMYQNRCVTRLFTAVSENLVGSVFFALAKQQFIILRHGPNWEKRSLRVLIWNVTITA